MQQVILRIDIPEAESFSIKVPAGASIIGVEQGRRLLTLVDPEQQVQQVVDFIRVAEGQPFEPEGYYFLADLPTNHYLWVRTKRRRPKYRVLH